ncbi:MAG: dihydropteroate synthase [bacterium]
MNTSKKKYMDIKTRIVEISNPQEAERRMKDIGVHPEGIKWMKDKSIFRALEVEGINNKAANILKQEMLSIGGEVAVPAGILEFKGGSSRVLMTGTLKHYNLLISKLKIQPFGLVHLAGQISNTLKEREKGKTFNLKCGKYRLKLGAKPRVMGVLNITPDSFSDGGRFDNIDAALRHAEDMVKAGADIIDIGGESSRPGARSVELKEELRRVIPVIKKIAKNIKVPISIDTYKSRVAREALENGASIVNDISALRFDRSMASVVASYGVPVVLMHMQGMPRNMQNNPRYNDVVEDIIEFLRQRVNFAVKKGVKEEQIIVDPGIGFGKKLEHNLRIIKNLKNFAILGRPVLFGPSRKRFIGDILGVGTEDREEGTLASCVVGALNGAHILRVHDVGKVVRALKVFEAIH